MDCREDIADPDDTEIGKGHGQDFKDRPHDHLGVTPGDVQEGPDGAFSRAVWARRALGHGSTTRWAASQLHGVRVHGSGTLFESRRGCAFSHVSAETPLG